jgi:hypothetical protein
MEKTVIRLATILLTLVAWWTDASAQITPQKEPEVNIVIDGSAARYVLENPARALQNRDSIWNTFEGYRITRVWHDGSSYPLTWDLWEKRLNKFINDDSLTKNALKMLDDISALEKKEHRQIVKHLSSYLPAARSFNAHVYFVAFTIPYAFVVEQNNIGIEINADEWHNDPECLLNIVIHELFHVGYRLNSPDVWRLQSDPANTDELIAFNYAYLFKEGMANHVAFRALDLFPSEYKHEDYLLMEEEENIRNAFIGVNRIQKKKKTGTLESSMKGLWEIGVMQRAYYLAGAYMCQSIEEKFGRAHLSELVSRGSRQFVKEYNEIAPRDLKIDMLDFEA